MRTSIFAIAAATLAGIVSAQSLEGLPSCAQSCVLGFTSGSSIAGCSSLNVACICSNKDFLNSIACCLASKCSAADQATAVTYAQQLCKTANVSVPNSVTCSSTSSSGTATGSSGAASGSVSTTASSSPASTTGSSAGAASVTSSSSSAAASSPSATATRNAADHCPAAAGMGIAGGLAAVLALL